MYVTLIINWYKILRNKVIAYFFKKEEQSEVNVKKGKNLNGYRQNPFR